MRMMRLAGVVVCLALLASPARASEVEVISRMAMNNIVSNQVGLGLMAQLAAKDEAHRADAIKLTVQVERSLTGCKRALEAYAAERGVAGERGIVKLVGGYDAIIQHAVAMRTLLENRDDETTARFVEAATRAQKVVDSFFPPEEPAERTSE